jgi:hypothetical protein
MEPGVASVQAVALNPEICIIVVHKDNLPARGERKPTPCIYRKAAVLSRVMASGEGHHRGLRSGHVRTGVARELGRACCFPAQTAGKVRATGSPKGPGVDTRFPVTQRALGGDTNDRETAGYRIASDERSDRDEQQAVVAFAQYR